MGGKGTLTSGKKGIPSGEKNIVGETPLIYPFKLKKGEETLQQNRISLYLQQKIGIELAKNGYSFILGGFYIYIISLSFTFSN